MREKRARKRFARDSVGEDRTLRSERMVGSAISSASEDNDGEIAEGAMLTVMRV